ncbi:MAG: hypothetical protein ACTHMS_08955, partial [Jatrophihabitans sp.]
GRREQRRDEVVTRGAGEGAAVVVDWGHRSRPAFLRRRCYGVDEPGNGTGSGALDAGLVGAGDEVVLEVDGGADGRRLELLGAGVRGAGVDDGVGDAGAVEVGAGVVGRLGSVGW